MVTRTIRSASLAALGALLSMGGAAANDDLTCWQPNKGLTAAAGDYWTKERREKAIPDDDGAALTAPEPLELEGTERVDVNTPPYQYGGKLFYTRDGSDYAASAQFVVEDNILLAAAHSMWRGDKHATNVVFYRGYENGGGTRFDVDQAAILTAWIPMSANPPSLPRAASDYAALRTTTNSDAGKFTLSKDGTFTNVTMMGYPGNLEEGKYMYKQDSSKLAQVSGAYQAAPTEFGTGASGGAWFAGSGTPIVSVVSGQIVNASQLNMIGPAFTDVTDQMIAFVKGGCK